MGGAASGGPFLAALAALGSPDASSRRHAASAVQVSDPRRTVVVGGGVLGAAVAHRLQQVTGTQITLLEKEAEPAQHQSGHNSGVVHAGLYYEPGSLKAVLCRRGTALLTDFCTSRGIPLVTIGKAVVATEREELDRLERIEARAHANQVPGLRRLSADELSALEPHVRGVAALHSPTTGIVDYAAVTRRLLAEAVEGGATVTLGAHVTGIRRSPSGAVVVWRSTDGTTADVEADLVVVCAGLHGDRLAVRAGAGDEPRIVPFRGEYLRLRHDHRDLVRGLVYPVPDPRYPFLEVHFTPTVGGEVLIGPNAVLALAREGYGWRDVSPRDVMATLAWPGFRRFAREHWRTGVTEVWRSWSRRRYVESARRYVPELSTAHVTAGPRGVRAQALARSGALVDDFAIDHVGQVWALRNAPSPAATSSLAIAEHLVDRVLADR